MLLLTEWEEKALSYLYLRIPDIGFVGDFNDLIDFASSLKLGDYSVLFKFIYYNDNNKGEQFKSVVRV